MADVAVVGAGLVGGLAALGIARLGRRVLVLERAVPERRAGRLGIDVRNVAVSPASRELLERLDVWSGLEPAPYARMRVWEDRGTQAIEFAAGEVGRAELGWILEVSQAVVALWERLERCPGVELVTGAAVRDVSPGGEGVEIRTDAGTHEVALVVAADGARSAVRQALRVAASEFPTGHHALATVVETARPHAGTAVQRFLLDGPLALLPSREPRLSSVVWSQPEALARQRSTLDEAAFAEELERASEGVFGAVAAVDERFVFPLQQMLVASFNPHPRVLLVGDAARVLHPLAGLGVNVGFEDVRDLLAVLEAAAGDPGGHGVWRTFARQRRGRAQLMLGLMTMFRQVYASGDPVAQWLRNTGVGWLNRAVPVKRQIIREALGLGPLARRW